MAQSPVYVKTPQPPFHPKFFPNSGFRHPQFRPSMIPDSEAQNHGICHACSVRNAPLYVCVIEMAFIASVLALYVQHFTAQEGQTIELTVTFTLALLSAVVGICLILSLAVGLCLESSTLLVPHMIGQIVGICIMTIIGALTLLFTFTGVQYPPNLGPDFGAVFLAIGVLCLAMAMAEVWFFFLIRDAYVHLKRKEEEKAQMEELMNPPPPPEMLCIGMTENLSTESNGETNAGVPEDPKDGEKPTEEQESADPATLQRWWAEHFERQRKQKKSLGVNASVSPIISGPCLFPPPPSETEIGNMRPRGVQREPIVITSVSEEELDKIEKK